MKTVKTLLLVLAITFTSVLSANTDPIKEEPSGLNQEIAALLKNPKFIVDEDLVAQVTFVLNKDKEIVVLDVDTSSEALESYIKSRLNYSRLTLDVKSEKKIYVIPVRITAE